jgi:Na+/melibiose symporter-like transporter
MSEDTAGRLPGSVILSYALPALVFALPTIPVYIHLPTLYGVELGLGLAATGLVLLLARIFDAVTDPLIGTLSDRFGFRGNRRKPWIVVGAVVAGWGLFNILNPPAGAGVGYLLGWSLLLYAGWTMFAVPYAAWGAELSANYNERTRITSWREAFSLAGIVASGALIAATGGLGWSDARSIGALAWLAILLGLLIVPVLLWRVPERRELPRLRPPPLPWFKRLRDSAASLASNGPFMRLLAAWFLNGLANGIPAALFYLYLEYGLGAGTGERPLFILAYFLAAIAAVPLWLHLSRCYGKHRTWCAAMALACAAFAVVPFLSSGQFAAFAVICVITGMSLGADLTLPPSMQADVVDYDRVRSGRSRAGLQFALWAMSTKFALAVAVGLALPGLEAAGFEPAQPTPAGREALVMIYSLGPVVIKMAAVLVVLRFPLTAQKQAVIRRCLQRRDNRRLRAEET